MMLRRAVVLGMVVSGLLAGAPAVADEPKEPLRTEIPEEILAGTPPDVLSMLFPHLEMPKPAKDAELLVPKGTVNLALKKNVTASDMRPIIGELNFVTDGKKEGTEQGYVELGPGEQWVQIDLEKPSEIYAIYLWHFFREARSYHDVVVQVADDAEFTKNVQTVFNNDQDNTLKKGVGKGRAYIETNLGKLIDAKGLRGRYVRLYSNGNTANDLNHYVEVEVFGRPVEP